MERLALIGGAYSARSIIANAQRCVNLYPEINTRDALVPTTHYQRPGLVPLAAAAAGPWRALYRASNGNGYGISGKTLYAISSNWGLTALGTVTAGRSNICSMIDNGQTILVVDGSENGWEVDLATNVMSQIIDPTNTFVGADRVDYIDTFLLGNFPGTRRWWSTLENQLAWDPTFVASKTDYPDAMASLAVNNREIFLLGQLKSEIWFNAGNPLFPFAELPGAYIEHGVLARYSVASEDKNLYWLGQDLQGDGMVYRQRGYETTRISNHALEYAIRQMKASGATLADAIGYTWQLDGHVFYSLTFPSGDQTWVYDAAMVDPQQAWHQEAWSDGNGNLHRHRGNCFANLYGKLVVGDWENGTLYQMDPNAYTDLVAGTSGPIQCIRTFPHIGQARLPGTQLTIPTSGRRLTFNSFWLDFECGNAPLALGNDPPEVGLRWSDDKGKTWGNTVLQSAGAPGEYVTQPQWRGLGIARDRVFEVSHSLAGASALNGAWVDVEVLD